jgi:hypothetical protein
MKAKSEPFLLYFGVCHHNWIVTVYFVKSFHQVGNLKCTHMWNISLTSLISSCKNTSFLVDMIFLFCLFQMCLVIFLFAI